MLAQTMLETSKCFLMLLGLVAICASAGLWAFRDRL